MRADPTGNSKPIEDWHLNVEQEQVVAVGFEAIDGDAAIFGEISGDAVLAQHGMNHLSIDRVIFGDEDTKFGHDLIGVGGIGFGSSVPGFADCRQGLKGAVFEGGDQIAATKRDGELEIKGGALGWIELGRLHSDQLESRSQPAQFPAEFMGSERTTGAECARENDGIGRLGGTIR